MRTSAIGLGLRYAVLTVLAFVVLVPFLGIILAALHSPNEQVSGLSLPDRISWENFALAWEQAHFDHLVASSLIITAGVVPITVILASLAGYGLTLLRAPGSRVVTTIFVLGLTIPIELVVISLYYSMREVGLTNSYPGIILAEVALFLPFGVYWMSAHFSQVPMELVEASRIDGARDLTVLFRVLLPISWPAITTLTVLIFMWSWNQFLLVLVLMQDPDKRTAPAGLGYFVGEYSTNIPLLSAASLIVVLPIVVVYLIFQRSFVNGLTQGAVK